MPNHFLMEEEMRKGIIITLTFIVLFFIIYLFYLDSMSLQESNQKIETKDILVPENLNTLYLSDLQNNKQEVSTKDSNFTLLIIADPKCHACDVMLEDVYNNKHKFLEKGINFYFLWLYDGHNMNNFIQSIETKINSYMEQLEEHLIIEIDEYKKLGFKTGPIPLISIYNQEGLLMFQSYGYNNKIVEQMLNVDVLEKPYIDIF